MDTSPIAGPKYLLSIKEGTCISALVWLNTFQWYFLQSFPRNRTVLILWYQKQLFCRGSWADHTERWQVGSREEAQSQSSFPGLYGPIADKAEKNSTFSQRQWAAAPLEPLNVCCFTIHSCKRFPLWFLPSFYQYMRTENKDTCPLLLSLW